MYRIDSAIPYLPIQLSVRYMQDSWSISLSLTVIAFVVPSVFLSTFSEGHQMSPLDHTITESAFSLSVILPYTVSLNPALSLYSLSVILTTGFYISVFN